MENLLKLNVDIFSKSKQRLLTFLAPIFTAINIISIASISTIAIINILYILFVKNS